MSNKKVAGKQRVPVKKKALVLTAGVATVVAVAAGSTAAAAHYSDSRKQDAVEQQVVATVREQVELSNEAAFAEAKASKATSGADHESFVPIEGLRDLHAKNQEVAQAMAESPRRSLTVDEIGVSVSEIRSAGEGKVVADLEITRHIAGEDAEWVDLIPHEIIYDGQGSIISVVAHDDDFFYSLMGGNAGDFAFQDTGQDS